MDEPAVGREYRFIRRRGGDINHARFIRFEDGSAILDFRGEGRGYNFDNHAEAWRHAVAELERLGYEEVGEAIRRGIVSAEEAAQTHRGIKDPNKG